MFYFSKLIQVLLIVDMMQVQAGLNLLPRRHIWLPLKKLKNSPRRVIYSDLLAVHTWTSMNVRAVFTKLLQLRAVTVSGSRIDLIQENVKQQGLCSHIYIFLRLGKKWPSSSSTNFSPCTPAAVNTNRLPTLLITHP